MGGASIERAGQQPERNAGASAPQPGTSSMPALRGDSPIPGLMDRSLLTPSREARPEFRAALEAARAVSPAFGKVEAVASAMVRGASLPAVDVEVDLDRMAKRLADPTLQNSSDEVRVAHLVLQALAFDPNRMKFSFEVNRGDSIETAPPLQQALSQLGFLTPVLPIQADVGLVLGGTTAAVFGRSGFAFRECIAEGFPPPSKIYWLGSTARILDRNKDGSPTAEQTETTKLRQIVGHEPLPEQISEAQMIEIIARHGSYAGLANDRVPADRLNAEVQRMRSGGAFVSVEFTPAEGKVASTEDTINEWLSLIRHSGQTLDGLVIEVGSSNPHIRFQELVVANCIAGAGLGIPNAVHGSGFAQEKISVDLGLQTLAKVLNEELKHWRIVQERFAQ